MGAARAGGPASLAGVRAAAGGSGVPRGGTRASGRCEFGELRPPRLPEPGNGVEAVARGARLSRAPCLSLEGGKPRPESNPTQVGRRGPQTVEPFERALLFASCKLVTSLETFRLFKL